MTEINIPLLRKAVEWVEEQDALQRSLMRSKHSSREWAQEKIAVEQGLAWNQLLWLCEIDDCGTACCFAGYVALETGFVSRKHDRKSVATHAREVLGLTHEQAAILFGANNNAESIRIAAERIAGERL